MNGMALRPVNAISLCTGGGGLDLALELAMPAARAVCMVEREAFAVAHLVEKMRAGFLAACPVWSDVTSFNGRAWRGAVDIVFGGIPCQPHSAAGKRLGREDERDLWSHARRIFVQSGASICIIENVEGMLTTGGAERVVRDLERLGCVVEGGLFSAAEVGFPHRRNRVVIMAYHPGRGRLSGALAALGQAGARPAGTECCELADADSPRSQGIGGGHDAGGRETSQRHAGLGGGTVLENADGRQPARRPGGPGEPEATGPHCQPAGSGDVLVDAARSGRRIHQGSGSEGIGSPDSGRRGQAMEHAQGVLRGAVERGQPDRDGLPISPPGPGDADGWRYILETRPELEPAVRRMADGMAHRVDRLRMCGNGVHPLAVGNGIRTCLARIIARLAAAGELVLMGNAA